MNEITRIHLAKIPYNIEITAKKDLEKYVNKLEQYASEQDWFQDIEIRITEILSERGIIENGVVSDDDVLAIKEQLGNPEDFLDDDNINVDHKLESGNSRRLYRDTDTALLGGVMGGIAKYLNIDSVWTRLVLIALLIASFGTAFVVYIILWIVVPPAKTVAEKLHLAGQPVTLSTIKGLREQEENTPENQRAKTFQNILFYGAGILSTIGAVGSLLLTIYGGIGLIFLSSTFSSDPLARLLPGSTLWSWVIYILFIVSGLLLTALFSIISVSLFRKKFTKRIGIAIVAIIISGMVTSSLATGMIWYVGWSQNNHLIDSRFTKTVNLPDEFTKIENLVVDADLTNNTNYIADVNIEYVVDSGIPRYEMVLDEKTKHIVPVIIYSEDNRTATLSFETVNKNEIQRHDNNQILNFKIYGPTLNDMTITSGAVYYSNEDNQNLLTINAESGSFEAIGSYKNVNIQTQNAASVIFSNASVENLTINTMGGYSKFGVVRTLIVTQTDVCPAQQGGAWNAANRLIVQGVASGKFIYNGVEKNAETIEAPCGQVIIGSEDKYEQAKEYED